MTTFYPLSDVMITQMEERFSENDLDVTESVEQILIATSLPSVPQAAFQTVSDLYNLNQDDLKAGLTVFITHHKEKEKAIGEEISRGHQKGEISCKGRWT